VYFCSDVNSLIKASCYFFWGGWFAKQPFSRLISLGGITVRLYLSMRHSFARPARAMGDKPVAASYSITVIGTS
jgi:hypothetical protein